MPTQDDIDGVNKLLESYGSEHDRTGMKLLGIPAQELSKGALLGGLVVAGEQLKRQERMSKQSHEMHQLFREKARRHSCGVCHQWLNDDGTGHALGCLLGG